MSRTNLRRIFTLTAQPEGPTGRQMEQIAQEIVDEAKDNAAVIMRKLVMSHPEVLESIDFVRRGREIRVGIRNEGRVSFYLAQKEAREHIWLTPAVEDVMRQHPQVLVQRGIPK